MSACSLIEDHLVGNGQSVMWITMRWLAESKRARRLRDVTHTITAQRKKLAVLPTTNCLPSKLCITQS